MKNFIKKYGLVIGIVSLCIVCCFFFLVGMTIGGFWFLIGIPFAVLGGFLVMKSDEVNKGFEHRAKQKAVRDEALK